MAGLAESLFPRSSKLGHLSGYHPRALLGAGLDVASLPGRAYASLGRMEDESYLDALGRTGPRYVVGQGEGDELADAILRDPLTPMGFGVGAAIKGLRPILGLGADLGINAAGMAADQYASTGAVNGGEIGAGAGMGALLGLGGMAKGGKRSMISPEEREANFRNWFGDSKVVDADGKPLVVYHGTASDFSEFMRPKAIDKEGRRIGMGWGKGKFYFADNPGAASVSADWAGKSKDRPGNRPSVMPVHLKIKNPISADDYMAQVSKRIASGMDRDAAIALVDSELKRQNIDGIVDLISGGHAVFASTQIKSATGNRGTFDPNDPNITHFAGSASVPSRNRAATRLERQAAQVAYDKYGRPREESAVRPVTTFQGLGSLLSSPSDTYYTRGGR